MRLLAPIFALLALGATTGFAPEARGQSTPVVVELFTSQGCVSCPPADDLFGELARRPGVIALALHVDYWDYLGWTDVFGDEAHTERQRAYAKTHRQRSIYTPQVIVQGEDMLIGHDAEAITARIEAHRRAPTAVTLEVARDGPALEIAVAPAGSAVGAADVHVVRYLPSHVMTIESGENAGLSHTYSNIVVGWDTIGRWDGRSPAEFSHDDGGDDPVAVIVQATRHGPVLAAATLR